MNYLEGLICKGREIGATDLHLAADSLPIVRINGVIRPMPDEKVLTMGDLAEIAGYMLSQRKREKKPLTDYDFTFVSQNKERQRVNIFEQKGTIRIAIRFLQSVIPSMEQLGYPPIFKDIALLPRGLVLVTGPTGSGKTTTLASMVNLINYSKNLHILTIEDPIEYEHQSVGCLIDQREVGADTTAFASAIRSSLREDPDVILVGEMRDLETVSAAVTAAETGHLVLSTLHTNGAASTISRIIDVFPSGQQDQIRTQLSNVLRAIISQQLIPRIDVPGRIAAYEILLVTDAVSNMIRENKAYQIENVLQTNTSMGMRSMDMDLANLYIRKMISREDAYERAINKAAISRILGF